ncbi:MAG: HesA/MoeB/ThiF family protein [Scytonematopsis contorta HA4267-MV1]|jgi:molybdopterin/thiamine biosynthesis adenylyltransferase|nr:HesA/MoeB/ThiF family protein [Scytonematopsis contorta HA4267-MV1]
MVVQLDFNQFELERYSRQIRMSGFGLESQRKLKASTVMISRVGGVGGTVAMNLARAGVGRLVIAHGGHIVPEYLNRMQLALPSDLDRPCTEVFVEKLQAINPEMEVIAVPENVNEKNITSLVSQADLIVDGAPLFEERYLMNQEAVKQGKPLVMAAMYSTEGYVTTFIPGKTPCLACIYPEKPDWWTNIKVFPAIGPGPVIVGSMAAMEAIKTITGFGTPLLNKLWFFDLENNIFKHLRIQHQKNCPICGHIHN